MRVGDLVDDLLRLRGGLATFGGDVDRAVVLDRDLGAGVLLDLVDHLALRTDDLADLVDRDRDRDDARRGRTHLGRAVDALVDHFENRGAGLMRLLERGGEHVGRNAVELRVELQCGDEVGGAGDLEIHVAERVFGAQDVGERLVDVFAVHIARDQAHRDARDRGLERHAGRQQRQRGGAHGTHRRGAVRTDGLGDLTDRVRELLAARQHRHNRLFGERAMADLAALRRADAAGLTGRIRRHLVIVHVALGLRTAQRVDLLLHLEHVERRDAKDLRFATLEQRGAVHARHNVHFGGQRADVAQATAVDAVVLGQDAAAHDLALQFLERVAQFLVFLRLVHIGELDGQRLAHALLDLVDALLARQLLGDRQRLVEVGVRDLVDAVVQVVGVFGEQREVARLLGGDLLEFVLRVAQHLDERLGSLKATSHNLFVRLGLALVIDERPRVLAGARLDHRNRDVAILNHAARDHDLEDGALTLAPARERDPLAVDESQAHAADGARERQAGDERRRGRRVQRDHVVRIVGIDGEHRLHNLHLIAQGVREERAQRAVDDAARENGLRARTAFAAEERARDLARGVHLLFHVDGQREEIVILLRAAAGGRGRQHHGVVVEIGGHRTISLLCEAARLKAQRALAI